MDLDKCSPIINDEFFLKIVCNYPAIYDPQRKGYSNRVMTDRAWENVALSLKCSVEDCKKKWKSLREKFHREKQKLSSVNRSGMQYVPLPKWPFMSFFEFMFENRTPRETSSSDLLGNNNSSISTDASIHVNVNNETYPEETIANDENSCQFIEEEFPDTENLSAASQSTASGSNDYQIPLMKPTLTVNENRRGKKRKAHISNTDPILGVLGDISTAVKNVGKLETDKLSEFAKYMVAELHDLPKSASNEFIDETLIRLLQLKRKFRQP